MADQTVTLTDAEWNQLTAILANATGYLVLTKLFNQLQAQTGMTGASLAAQQAMPGDGLDLEPPAQPVRRVPRN